MRNCGIPGIPHSVRGRHRCRKFFTFWERGDTFRKSMKRLIIQENISNIEDFGLILPSYKNFSSIYIKYIHSFDKNN
jgi:hypothetical protein